MRAARRCHAGIYPGLLREAAAENLPSLADELTSAGAEFCARRVRALHFGGDGKLVYKTRASATLFELAHAGFLGVRRCVARRASPLQECKR
jgi:hypothetical protein